MPDEARPLLTLLRIKAVHAPEPSEAREVLVADGRIAALGRDLPVPEGWPVDVVQLPELTAVPGFIDQHVHVTGGGGEGGFATRCPEITAERIARAGIATIVGVLGSDSVSRSPADLLAKVRGLKEEGPEAFMYTGAYRVPPPTLTGDVQRDLAWIPEVIGLGELAVSDHRSAQPTQAELERLVADVRVGAMLAGKLGICHFHLGDGARGLAPLRRLLEETEIPPRHVIPTHVNRRRGLLEEAAEYARTFEAAVDVTAFDFPGEGSVPAAEAVGFLIEAGVPSRLITMSSDCNGSLPVFDAAGAYQGMRVAGNEGLVEAWRRLVGDRLLPMAEALALVGVNVARVLGLDARKGRIAAGMDADITLVDDDLVPRAVFARGRRLV